MRTTLSGECTHSIQRNRRKSETAQAKLALPEDTGIGMVDQGDPIYTLFNSYDSAFTYYMTNIQF